MLVERAKQEVVAGLDPAWFGDQDLLDSWRRSVAALQDPGCLHEVPVLRESDIDDEPLMLLREPLDALAASLADTSTALLLANERGVVLHRWHGDDRARRHLDATGSVRAANLSEAAVGTNGIGTVALTGRALQIAGAEHFCDFFAGSACTTEAIRHPASGQVIAVVSLSCPMTPRLDLLRAWMSAIRLALQGHLSTRLGSPAPVSLDLDDLHAWATRRALADCDGDIARAARRLGISRATMYRRLRRLRISPGESADPGAPGGPAAGSPRVSD